MKLAATLVLITRTRGQVEEILLARKKTGEIGIGAISAPGGKLEEHESLRQCATRETWEEMRISIPNNPDMLKEVALLDVFRAQGDESLKHFMRVFVYAGRAFSGEPVETTDMEKPFWASFDQIPYEQMYAGDEIWMSLVLRRSCFTFRRTHFTAYRRDGACVSIKRKWLKSFSKLMGT